MNRELENLKAAVVDLVSGIQRIHQRRRDLDDEAASLYRAARANGLQVKFAKEVILQNGCHCAVLLTRPDGLDAPVMRRGTRQ